MATYHEVRIAGEDTPGFFVEQVSNFRRVNAQEAARGYGPYYLITGRSVEIDDTFTVQGDREEWQRELQARCRKALTA